MSEGVLWDTVITPMPMDQVFKEVYSLLKSIGVSVIEEIEPVYIKGFWNGKKAGNIREYPRFAHANEQISRMRARVRVKRRTYLSYAPTR